MSLLCLLIGLSAAVLHAQKADPKPKPSDYPVHAQAGDLGIGAEYMVRSISTPEASFTTDDYLVVELALYPPPSGIDVNAQQWTLRVNGRKQELLTQTPGMVIASLKYPDWSRQRSVVVGAGPIIIGQPAPVGRFPGDNRDPRGRTPRVPEVQTTPDGVEREPVDIGQVVERAALPEGSIQKPVTGYIFFPWRGNPAKLKSVELIYRPGSDAAGATLRLR